MSISSISFSSGGQTQKISYGGGVWSSSTLRMDSQALYAQNVQQDLTLNVAGSTIPIPQGTITATQLDKIGNVLEGLTLSEATTGPSQAVSGTTKEGTKTGPTPQQISEALGKIHDIMRTMGEHPHLGNEFSGEIYELLHPETANPATTQSPTKDKNTLASFAKPGTPDENGRFTIDFLKLGNPPLDPETIQKAGISGKMWIDENGKFQMDVTFNFGKDAVDALKALKEKVNNELGGNSLGNSPISFNPEDAGTLESTDLAILERGGQIQFKPLPDGKTLKLILDPGEDGQKDGLTIQVRDKDDGTWTENPRKIPLSAVFEGQEYEGHRVRKDGHPILENWRARELFERSVIHTEKTRIIPFTARFDRLTANNTNDPARIQASNTLWDAVYTYLGATVSPEEQEAQQTSEQQTAQEKSVLEAILEPGNESKPETAKIVAKAEKLSKKPLRTKNLIDAGKHVVDAVKILEESLRLQNPSSDSEKPLSSTLQLAEEQAPTHIQPERAKEIVTPEDVLEVAEVVVPKAQAVEINTQAINPTVIKDLSQALSSLRRGLENLPDGPDDIYKAFEELKNNLKELQGNVPELFSNPLFLQQAQKNNPELFEKIQPGLAQLQQVTASILANIKDHATSAPNDELSEIFELVKSVNAAVNQLLVKPKLTPYEESDDILNAAKDLVAGGLQDLVTGLQKPDSPT